MSCKPIIPKEVVEYGKKCHKSIEPETDGCERAFDEASLALQKTGKYEEVGSGSFRRVYAFNNGKCVLKLAKPEFLDEYEENGFDSNKREIETWNRTKKTTDGLSKFLAPVLYHGRYGEYVVMPFAKGVPLIGYIDTMKSELSKSGFKCQDLRAWNIGLVDNNPVIIDYGLGIKCTLVKK